MARPVAGLRFALAAVGAAAAFALLTGCGGGVSPVAPQPQNLADNAPTTDFPPGTVFLTSSQIAEKFTYANLRYHITPVTVPGAIHRLSVVYPGDLTNGGGAVLTATTENDIFLNTTSAAVGTPTTFQTNLDKSTFISVLNQYNGVTSAGKFPVGTSFSSTVASYTNLIDQDQLFAIIHAAAKTGGTGYGHEYNVFMAKGLDTCFDFGPCYAPDLGPPTFQFCGYHASIDFTDLSPTHVIFSIIPYQDVPGCGDNGLTGDSVTNSTATTLSHEFFESSSDADPNTGWFSDDLGMEMADICANFRATETLNAVKYVIQPEYSNSLHGCFF